MSSEPSASAQAHLEGRSDQQPGLLRPETSQTRSAEPASPPSGETAATLRPDTARTAVEAFQESSSQEGGVAPSTSQVQIVGPPRGPAFESPIDAPVGQRNRSNVTLGSERPDHEVTFPPHQGENGRVSRHATVRIPGPERPFSGRPRTGDSMRRSTLDWVVPVEERPLSRHSVEDRLAPTLEHAIRERDKLKVKAKFAKWAINVAAALQVFLGSLTTGISAARLNGNQLGIATTVLGILSTLVGAFLARVRATEEPESSLIRAHDLDAFIRDLEAFRLDYGHDTGDKYSQHVDGFRRRFEVLLGNIRAEALRTNQKAGDQPALPPGPGGPPDATKPALSSKPLPV